MRRERKVKNGYNRNMKKGDNSIGGNLLKNKLENDGVGEKPKRQIHQTIKINRNT